MAAPLVAAVLLPPFAPHAVLHRLQGGSGRTGFYRSDGGSSDGDAAPGVVAQAVEEGGGQVLDALGIHHRPDVGLLGEDDVLHGFYDLALDILGNVAGVFEFIGGHGDRGEFGDHPALGTARAVGGRFLGRFRFQIGLLGLEGKSRNQK